jgi:hypothetical protein
MTDLTEIAPRFVEMAHEIVWANVATVDTKGRPRTRVLHPLWQWDGTELTAVIATSPNSVKRAHLDATPFVSVGYWAANQDTCNADCAAEWILDDAGRQAVWDAFVSAPEPVGYDPTIIPQWADGPQSPEFAGLRLTPWRLRLMDGALMTRGEGQLLTWSA